MEMKELTSYITEKLDINKVNLHDSGFPFKGTVGEMVDFLKQYGFEDLSKKIKREHLRSFYVEDFEDEHKRGYTIIPKGRMADQPMHLIFADMTNGGISKNNELFCIDISSDNKKPFNIQRHWGYGTNNSKSIYDDNELQNIFNEYFSNL